MPEVFLLEVILHQGAEAVVGDLVEVGVVEDGAVGGEVAIGGGSPLIFEAEAEGLDVVADGRGDAVDAVEVSKILAALHIDTIVVSAEVIEILPCPEILHVADEKVVAHLLAIGDVEVTDGSTEGGIVP